MKQSSSHQPAIEFVNMKPGGGVLNLFVQGFSKSERQLLDAIVQLSQRRQPKIVLVIESNAEYADIVMVDAADPEARRWANTQPWLKNKAVIWVDAPDASGRTVVQRPIQWSVLPVLLARVLEQQVPVNAPCMASAQPGNNWVLVVDDSIAVRAQLRALLEPRGLAVTEAESAEAAIKAATASSYACILMDVLMSGIDGYEACRQIKANTYGGARPVVVMLTSKTSPFDRIRGKMAGCDAYLTKPVDEDRLFEVISRYIAKPVEPAAAKQRISPPQFA